MSLPADFAIDRRLARERFSRHADEDGFLAVEVARRMSERLAGIRIEPRTLLNLGCGSGADFAPLTERYPGALALGIDFALPRLRLARGERRFFERLLGRRRGPSLICADAEALPLARASVTMLWSNLMLNWLADPLPAIREMHRVLEVGGMLMFSTLGPDTLKELRAVLPDGHGERVHRFIDMHDLGDALVSAGFGGPVMDMETITLNYEALDTLFSDLRSAGAANASSARPRGLSGKEGWRLARERYERLRRDGRLPATVEIVYGHAWKEEARIDDQGRAVIRFSERPTR